jgi:hypothetical protein
MPPSPFDCAGRWRELRAAIRAGIEEWRLQHPKAPRWEIEAAGDAHLADRRPQMWHDVALARQAAELSRANAQERPRCPQCETPVEARGPRERQVTTHQGKTVRVRRSSAGCPACQVGLFPSR